MLDLRSVTDDDVRIRAEAQFDRAEAGSSRWRLYGAILELSGLYSFSSTKTYPRPDHPDPRKRLPLEYLLVAILVSLRTTLENEQRAMDQLIAALPDLHSLYGATVSEIATLIVPAGMPDSKALRIVSALNTARDLDGGLESLAQRGPEAARSYLLALPGFGPKAADCFLTIGLGIPSMVVDVNVFKVAVSLFDLSWSRPANYANARQVLEVKTLLDDAVGNDAFNCQIAHTLLLLEGKGRRGPHDPSRCGVAPYCLTCARVGALALL